MTDPHFSPDAIRARLVPIPGARNLRELGGYPTRDGRRVRRGLLYRGGHPADIAPEDLAALEALGLRAIVDLRTTEERLQHPYSEQLRANLDYWAREYSLSLGEFTRILRDPDTSPEIMRDRMMESYRRFAEEQHEGIAALFRLLLRNQAPLMVNCTAGKDRTGVASAILLAALGVEQEVIRRDYALTEELHPPHEALFKIDMNGPFAYLAEIDRDVWVAMMRSEPAYIDAMFEGLYHRHGTIEDYLRAAHGIGAVEITALRDALLED